MKKIASIITLLLLSISLYAKSYSVFYKGESCGVIDEKRKVVIEPLYNYIEMTEDGYFCCENINHEGPDSADFFDKKIHKVLSLPNLGFFWPYSAHEWVIGRGGSKGNYELLDLKTKKTTPIEIMSRENCPTYINNVALILTYYDEIEKYGYRIENRNGKIIFSGISQADREYSEGLIPVITFDGRSGYLNETGKMVIEVPLYEDYRMGGLRISPLLKYSFHEGVAFIQTEKDQWYLLDKKGNKKSLPPEYDFTERRYSNGLTVVKDKSGKFGYMDKDFKLVIPCQFDSARSFVGKYAAAVYQGKDVVVDAKGKIYFCEEFK